MFGAVNMESERCAIDKEVACLGQCTLATGCRRCSGLNPEEEKDGLT